MKAYVNIKVKIKSLASDVRDHVRIYPGVVSCDTVSQGQFDVVAVIEATGGDHREKLDQILLWISRVPSVMVIDANFVEP